MPRLHPTLHMPTDPKAEPLLHRPRASSAIEPARQRRFSTDDSLLREGRGLSWEGPTIGRSASWDGLTRALNHVEDVLLHNEEGAVGTIGRTLPEHLTRGASMRSKLPDLELTLPVLNWVKLTLPATATIFNLVSTMLGSGMLSLPWVFARLGMRGGLLLMLLTPLVGERTIWFVTEAVAATSGHEPERALPPVVERTLGKRAALVCAMYAGEARACIILAAAGCLTAHAPGRPPAALPAALAAHLARVHVSPLQHAALAQLWCARELWRRH